MASSFSIKRTDISKYLEGSKNKSYFVTAVTILFLVMFIILGVVPAYNAVVAQYNQNKDRDIAIEQLTTKINNLKALDKQNLEKASLIEYFNKVFPSSVSQDKVIEQFFTLAEKNSVFVSNVSFSDQSTRAPLGQTFQVGPQVNYLVSSITVEGSQVGLQTFVQDLENSRTIFNVLSIDLAKKSEEEIETDSGNGDHVLKLNLQFFYYLQATNVVEPTN